MCIRDRNRFRPSHFSRPRQSLARSSLNSCAVLRSVHLHRGWWSSQIWEISSCTLGSFSAVPEQHSEGLGNRKPACKETGHLVLGPAATAATPKSACGQIHTGCVIVRALYGTVDGRRWSVRLMRSVQKEGFP
eukprot:3932435-Rhodomonas_salina.1